MPKQFELDVSKFEQTQDYKSFNPSKDDSVKIDFVKKRENEMREGRTAVDRDWDLYQTMIDAIFEPYPDERSSSTVPLASSLIELYVADAAKIKTEYNFRGENQNFYHQAKTLEHVWKYDWRKNQRDRTFNAMEYITAGFGTGVGYVGYESSKKEQLDPILDNEGNITWKKRTIKDQKIIVADMDIRSFYIDNRATRSIDEASDCIYKRQMSYEKFRLYESNPLYSNMKYVAPKSYNNEYDTFTVQEEDTKQGDFVEIIYYWNIDTDVYMEIANGVLVREHPMISTINGTKALPFFVRPLGKKNYSIYGRGLCEGLLMFNSEVNNLRELLMDGIRRSNSQVLAIGNGLTFDGREFSYDNEILTFDGNLGANFQQISGNPPNASIFNYIDRLYKDVAIYTGIDIQNIIGTPQQTAFQTEVQREASQKRINVWITSRNLAYERFANLYKDALQTYFPIKTAKGLYPEIELEDEKMVNGKLRKAKGKNMLQVTPEMLKGDIYVDVYTNTTAPTINMVDRQLKLELVQAVGAIAQGYAQAKQLGVDIDAIMPLKKTLTDLASDYNLELPTGAESEDVQERKSEIIAKLQGMMRSQEVAQEGQQVMQAEQQAAPMEAEAETQGAPRRPILPPNPSQGPTQRISL